MKICFVTSGFFGHDKKFIRFIVDKKHELDVFITRPWEISENDKIAGVNFHTITPSKYIPSKLFYFISLFVTYIRLKDYLRKEKPNVLHGGNVQTAGLLCALTNYQPFLLMPYGSDIMVYPDKNFLLRWITCFVIKKSDSITCDAICDG